MIAADVMGSRILAALAEVRDPELDIRKKINNKVKIVTMNKRDN